MAHTNPPPAFDKGIRPSGENFVWLTAMGLAAGIIMVVGLLLLIFWNGITVFWPKEVVVAQLENAEIGIAGKDKIAGAIIKDREKLSRDKAAIAVQEELQFFIGNKDVYGQMFHFVDKEKITSMEKPEHIMVAERMEYGNAIFFPKSLAFGDGSTLEASDAHFNEKLEELIAQANQRQKTIRHLEKDQIGEINSKMEKMRLAEKAFKAREGDAADAHPDYQALIAQKTALSNQYETLAGQAQALRDLQKVDQLTYTLITGEEVIWPVGAIVEVHQPNRMNFLEKVRFFLQRMWGFLTDNPREANTEGGVFPAIFGTFAMTVLMSAAVVPFGVLAAIYLREYAKQGPFVQAIRIAVNNLAGVPSIVYGVFGLGFFVYFLGSGIDQLLFSDRLPTPTFGTGGIIWASLTLALMTVPVVVVATEEALAAVPRGMREASLACGASKWQTIQRIVLPASASGIITGLILAMARGAGEVAPLMLVGVVKLAPDLPFDFTAPFIHLDRKFMHLGFHIYDLGFQSPDSEAAKPMVFATTFLLIMLVVVLNLGAILLRDNLRKKYASGTF